MPSSQLKPEGIAAEVPASPFPFAWRSPVVTGTETVITSLRPEPPVVSPVPAASDQPPDLLRRLFPTGGDTDDALGIHLGHFTIQRRIGIGGMGSVFLATDDRLGRNVALKILSPSITTDPAAVLRFQNEARAAARLDHDNIARIFYYGDDAGLHYIAYEYIPGSNLRDVIRAKERLAPAEAVNYAMQLAAALSHTAAAGVIHRDIKPSNVLITPQGRAKLVDLGLARKESAESSLELTVAGTTLGTFDYISPEQAKDPRNVDVRSDIYSLGCTLYHMLTGEPPYPEGTVLQKLLDHQGKEAPDPARKNRRVPPALSMIVRKMMSSDPRRRYSTPAKLLSDLLHVARQLGSGAVPIDGQVWLTATRSEQPAWQGNIGWIATAAALLIVVIAMERFPALSRQLNPRALTASSSTGTATSRTLHHDEVTKSGQSAATVPSAATTPRLSDSDGPRMSTSRPPVGAHQPATGRTTTDVARSDSIGAPKIFEQFSTLTPLVPSESESLVGIGALKPVSNPAPESSKSVDPLPDPVTSTRPGNGAASTTSGLPGPSDVRNVISIIGGKSYPTLEAACSEAKDGSIIELRYNGRRGEPERPFRISNKDHVIIRSGIGFRPIIEFVPSDPNTDVGQSRMITVTGGSLDLVNVDLILKLPERVTADRWALFKLERPKDLQLHDVTVTVINPSGQPACVIEQVAAPGQGVGNVGMMKNGMPLEPPRITILDSVFRGQCDLIMLRDAVPARFQLKDTAVALQGVLMRAICQTEFSTSDSDRVTLELDHTTCLTAEGLIATEGIDNLTDHTPPLIVTARNNIIWCAPNRPLIAMIDAGDLMEMQRKFIWIGDWNQYDSLAVFWQLGGRQGPASSRLLNFEEWRSLWGSGEGAGSINSPVLWRNKPSDRSWTKIDLASMDLDQSVGSAGDGRGATLTKLPVPPATGSELQGSE